MKLVLFDIDGTLVDSGGAGRRALERAFGAVLSVENAFNGYSMAGKTDIQIVKEALALRGVSAGDGLVPSILASYLEHLGPEMKNPWKKLKPGVREILDVLGSLPTVGIGLLTGNLREGARMKLEPFGIFDRFSFGAFGSDSEDRIALLPLAVRRYTEMSGVSVPYQNCIVVGDTPRDVASAKPYGAVSVAVATGPYSIDELRETGADIVLKDLTGRGAFMKIIL